MIAPEQRLAELTYVVVDVETTGTAAGLGDRVTELAAVVVRAGRVHETFSTLVNPERPIPTYITRLTGISSAMVREAPAFRAVSGEVRTLLGDHVFVAHNAAFDWGFVNMELARAGETPLEGARLCTVRLARRLLSHLPRRSLDHVTAHYGITVEHRHRALGDAVATAHVFTRLLDDAYARGCDTWSDLDRLLHPGASRKRRWSALPHSSSDDRTA
ncbi:MAG TPA: exonuclease domain-containing protein [Gemmatimonadaceae bacterium]|nr:exonuclease domain-containing protein [Gemmatimonadaceae bacterium]